MSIERKRTFAAAVTAAALAMTACSGSTTGTPMVATTAAPTPSQPTDAPVPAQAVVPSTTSRVPLPPVADFAGMPEGAIRIEPGDVIARAVAAADPGTVFVLGPGVHRMQSVVPRDGMVFFGEEGAVMTGARLLEGFSVAGSLWRIDGVSMTGGSHGRCVNGYDGCRLDQDLFMDDEMLWQVTTAEDLQPGSWFWDTDSIYVASDPTDRKVELSVTPYAFLGSADDVVINGIRIEKYATPAQDGTIQAQDVGDGERGQRWVIEDVVVTGAHGAGVRTGDFTTIRNSTLSYNGQLGITVSGGTDVLIEGNEIAHNNIAGFDWAWEAGGAKFTQSVGLVVRDNRSHDNMGPGLWTDIATSNTLYEGNVVFDNTGPGIFHEISYEAVIKDNVVTGNGFGKAEWLWGAGILLAASSDVIVSGNTVLGNADGIAGIQQDRGVGPRGPYVLDNVTVIDNEISISEGQTGVVSDTGDDAVFSRSILFAENVYRGVDGPRFAWDGDSLDRQGWLDIGQGTGSVWL